MKIRALKCVPGVKLVEKDGENTSVKDGENTSVILLNLI